MELEQRVQERTADLHKELTERKLVEEALQRSNAELERFNRLAVGREQLMIELKRQINKLAQEAGKARPYELLFLEEDG